VIMDCRAHFRDPYPPDRGKRGNIGEFENRDGAARAMEGKRCTQELRRLVTAGLTLDAKSIDRLIGAFADEFRTGEVKLACNVRGGATPGAARPFFIIIRNLLSRWRAPILGE